MQSVLSFLQNGVVYVAACVLLLGILIFVHELGHFLVARWCGVRVEVFSLGFGKKIWQKVSGDTTYCVSLIPLGGYVKMFGEQPGETIPAELRSVSFTHKKVSQRIAVVVAGPLMNLLFAIVVFSLVAMIGVDSRAPVIGDIDAGSAAEQAGFKSGDRILQVAGHDVQSYDEATDAMDEARGHKLDFKVRRASGEEVSFAADIQVRPNANPLSLQEMVGDVDGLTPLARAPLIGVPRDSPLWALGLRTGDHVVAINGQKVTYNRELGPMLAKVGDAALSMDIERIKKGETEKFTVTLAAGVAQGGMAGLKLESSEFYLEQVLEDSPAKIAGLQPGDRLVALNEKPVTKWEDVLQTIKTYDGKSGVLVEFMRDGEKKSVHLEPKVTSQVTSYGSEDKRYTIGITSTVEAAPAEVVVQKTMNPIKALSRGIKQSADFSVVTVLSFVRLFQNRISPKTVGGLLTIGQAAGETIKLGIGKFLTMMAIISINLFVLNLFPVPVLDGGHLVFYVIEAVKGSPLSLRKMEIAQQVGLMLLAGLMVFALFNDVTRLIFGRI